MSPKEAALRRSPSRYWPHEQRSPGIGNDELLRLQRLERERQTLDLVGQLMGDPPRSRQLWRDERTGDGHDG